MADKWETPQWVIEQDRKIAEARPAFEALPMWLRLNFGGVLGPKYRGSVLDKLTRAFSALHEWRYVNNQKQRGDDDVLLAIRIVCDAMATEITEAAGARQDPATIAWVVAGLRCPVQPFCRGCDSCFTVTVPHRHDVQIDPAGAPRG